jgi:drug/metabolite transporter (DMT)-like permease
MASPPTTPAGTAVPATPRRPTSLADLGLFYAAAVWGATFFMVKGALDDINPVVLVAYRFLIAGVLLFGFLLWTRRPILKDLSRGLVLAVILFGLYISQTIGLGITTASNSGFITGLFVAFVPVFMLTIFRRKPTAMEVVASGVSLTGLYILTGGLSVINAGDALTLLAAMTYALHLLYSDKFLKAGADAFTISCQQFLLIGIFGLLTVLIFRLPFTVGTADAGWTVLFLALFPTLSAFVVQMLAQKIVSPLRVSLIFALEPVFAAVFAWTLGGEDFLLRGAIGGLFICAGLVISGLPPRKTALNRKG